MNRTHRLAREAQSPSSTQLAVTAALWIAGIALLLALTPLPAAQDSPNSQPGEAPELAVPNVGA